MPHVVQPRAQTTRLSVVTISAAAILGMSVLTQVPAHAADTAHVSAAPAQLAQAQADRALEISPQSLSPEDFTNSAEGVSMKLTGCEPKGDVTFTIARSEDPKVPLLEETVPTNDIGNAALKISANKGENELSAFVGDYTVTATCGDTSQTGTFTVTEADIAVGLDIEPATVSATDFTDEDLAPIMTISGCTPEKAAHIIVSPADDLDVKAFETDVAIDDQGTGAVSIFALESEDPNLYVGKYSVRATCGDGSATGTFTVTEVEDPSSDADQDDSADAGGDDGDQGAEKDSAATTDASDDASGANDDASGKDGTDETGADADSSSDGGEPPAPGEDDSDEGDSDPRPDETADEDSGSAGAVASATSDGASTSSSSSDGSNTSVDSTSADTRGDDETDKSATSTLPFTGASLTGLIAGLVLIVGGTMTILLTLRRSKKD